jgi:hypothetical protein
VFFYWKVFTRFLLVAFGFWFWRVGHQLIQAQTAALTVFFSVQLFS